MKSRLDEEKAWYEAKTWMIKAKIESSPIGDSDSKKEKREPLANITPEREELIN